MREALSTWRPIVDEEIERLLSREMTAEDFGGLFGEPRFTYDTDALNLLLYTKPTVRVRADIVRFVE